MPSDPLSDTFEISPSDLEACLPELATLLIDTVGGGAWMGLIPPLSPEQSRAYWRALRPELGSGARVLLAMRHEGRIVATGQLLLPFEPVGLHRAELQKLMVDDRLRGRGFGRRMMEALHAAARRRDRTLVLLRTRHGDAPQRFYESLGYRFAGVVPGFSRGAGGERRDLATMYCELSA